MAAGLRAQVTGAAVQAYAWVLSAAPDATAVTGAATSTLRFTWRSFTGPARAQTVGLTTMFAGRATQTQAFAFRVDGTDSPAWSAPPTSDSSLPATTTDDGVAGKGTVSGPSYAVRLATGGASTAVALPAYNPDVPAAQTVTARLTFNGVAGPTVVSDTAAVSPAGSSSPRSRRVEARLVARGYRDVTSDPTPIPPCPRCSDTHVVRNGANASGPPTFRCRGCVRRSARLGVRAIARVVRRTLSFSKCPRNHLGALRHFIRLYNACRS